MIVFDIRINYFVCIIIDIDLGCSKKRAPLIMDASHRKTPTPPQKKNIGYKLPNCKTKNETAAKLIEMLLRNF